jgi:hypothetical protein
MGRAQRATLSASKSVAPLGLPLSGLRTYYRSRPIIPPLISKDARHWAHVLRDPALLDGLKILGRFSGNMH